MSALTDRLKHDLTVLKAEGLPSMYVKLEDMEALLGEAKAVGAVLDGWRALNDVQWMNIVNHDHAYESFSKDEAVHEAVKRTEAKLRELNAPSSPALPEQGWMPIETAPKDGTEILLRYPLQGNVTQLANFNSVHKRWDSKGRAIFPEAQKCEWHALPDRNTPPANVEQKEKQNG